ncbi:unnamed protein product [Phytophthora fragariaefolia]|uniref:Unnamed protein product n=1 Tax=Phytophthora fragariaefolia TaxID=1490495 RepID=A0A9W6XUJ9_9STRA|nr:unnamed protein product [Phytophthora fragariaefolia]
MLFPRAVPRVVLPTSRVFLIDELTAALEKEIVGGPHPAVVADEQQADTFAARARADFLEHELRETMKRVSQLEESEKTASALVRSLKEQVAQLENRNISLQKLHQSTNLERDSWSTERIRLDATIRDKERIIASMTADYHRDAGNRQIVLGRCYELTAQIRQLSDAVAMGNTSAHQLLKRQLADKDNEIRRLLRTIRMSPVVSEFQRRSPFLVVAATFDERNSFLAHLASWACVMTGVAACLRISSRLLSMVIHLPMVVLCWSPQILEWCLSPRTERVVQNWFWRARENYQLNLIFESANNNRGHLLSAVSEARVPSVCELALVDLLVRSPIMFIPGQPMPGLTATELSAFRSASETLRQAGLVVFAFTLPGTGYILARPTLRQDIEYPKIEVNPDAEIAWPGVCQLSFQPTARGSGKQGKEYIPPRQPQAKIDIGLRVQIKGTQDRRLNHTLAQRVELSPLLPEFPLPTRQSKTLYQALLLRSPEERSSPPTGTQGEDQHFHGSSDEDSDDEAGLAPLRRPQRTAAANCNAIQRLLHAGESDSDSEVLGETAGLEGADSSGVESSSTTKQTEAASMLASLSGATKSVVIRALPPGKHPAWSPGDSDFDGGDSTGGGSAATPPNLSNKLVESSDSSGDESTLADPSKSQAGSGAGSGSPLLASPTVAVRPPQVTTSVPVSAAANAPVLPKNPPPARSPVRPATSTSKPSSASKAKAVVPARPVKDASKPKPAPKAKPTAAIRSAKDGSKPKSASKPSAGKAKLAALGTKDGSKPKSASKPSAGKAKVAASDTKARAKGDGGVPPHHVDVKVLVARAAASARLDSRESGPMKRLRELPFFHKGSKRCWEKVMSSCAVSVTMEKTADGERIRPTPCSIADLAAFMDVDDSGHPWRSVLRLLPHGLFFVDNSVLEVVLGDAVVGAANHKIDGLPAPLVDTEVCFDPAIPFCPPVNLPWFPRTADWIAEAVRIDNHEPWRLWWLTAPGRHPYNTIFRLYHPEFPLFVPDGADSEMVTACVEDERLIAESEPPALHPNTPAPVNRPGEIEFCPPNIVHSV